MPNYDTKSIVELDAFPGTPNDADLFFMADASTEFMYKLSLLGLKNVLITTGEFSPTIFGSSTAGTPTYVAQLGKFTRIGNRVWGTVYLQISNKGGIAGDVRIGNLPFNANASIASRSALNFGYIENLNFASVKPLMGWIINSSTEAQLYKMEATGSPSAVAAGEITDTLRLSAAFQYDI